MLPYEERLEQFLIYRRLTGQGYKRYNVSYWALGSIRSMLFLLGFLAVGKNGIDLFLLCLPILSF